MVEQDQVKHCIMTGRHNEGTVVEIPVTSKVTPSKAMAMKNGGTQGGQDGLVQGDQGAPAGWVGGKCSADTGMYLQ